MKVNFCAGPAALPQPIYRELQQMIIQYKKTGVSILSLSHRDDAFLEVVADIQRKFHHLLNLNDDYTVLLMHGGATTQFAAVPINLYQHRRANYINSGYWSRKAIEEARKYLEVDVFNHNDDFPCEGIDYIHYTDNETIDGFQLFEPPFCEGVPVICDMSSSILSRPIDIEKYGLIYAGAQKNLGIPGVTVVIMRKDLLSNKSRIPLMMDYRVAHESNSIYNTPSVISWVTLDLILDHIIDRGGLKAMADYNAEKAQRLYQAIDQSALFYNDVENQYRSVMNVVFKMHDENLEQAFLNFAEANNIYGLSGHRSIGGFRASIYNAVTIEDVDYLIDTIKRFENEQN